MHEQNKWYGANGGRYAEHVYGLMAALHPATVLDYGCGKGGLEATVRSLVEKRQPRTPKISRNKSGRHRTMGVRMPAWTKYDPSIPGLDTPPEGKFDLVVCTDVLEHVEPEHIRDTMDSLWKMTGVVALLTFALRESNKTLPDGRNTHLIVEDRDWWMMKCLNRWGKVIETPWRNENTFMAVCFA
jgi:cyclopropane fatty-acyl-phospholipid synthase-like methyltransferase